MSGLDWLIARPVAHRGLHDAAAGVIENTPSAVGAAAAAGYAIEVDLQISADAEAMVHHDETLGRLTEGEGRLDAISAAELKQARFKATADRMMTLTDLLDLVAGRVALILELKSRFDRDSRLARRTAEVLRSYAGPVAAMSFDPYQVEAIQNFAPGLPRGIVAQSHRSSDRAGTTTPWDRLAYLRQGIRSQPHFIAYHVNDLPASLPLLGRYVLGMPLLTWTVRTPDDRRRAARWADQIIFEGFRP
jgi:glycerophosphoryl diester phosphodiesterase